MAQLDLDLCEAKSLKKFMMQALALARSDVFLSVTDIMAKGQKRSSREPKKPKAEKPKPATGTTSILKEKPGSGSRAKK